VNNKTFQELFCESRKCDLSEFRNRVFWCCVYPHAVPLAYVLRRINPYFFADDDTLIQQIALDRDTEEVEANLRDFQYVNNARRHWLRTGLKVRVSGRKVAALARALFVR
jgi:hypothetical protein